LVQIRSMVLALSSSQNLIDLLNFDRMIFAVSLLSCAPGDDYLW